MVKDQTAAVPPYRATVDENPRRRKLVAGNWKMNGSLAANEALLSALLAGLPVDLSCDVAVFAPTPYLAQVGGHLVGSSVALGAQDVSPHAHGAFTGETSASMLRELGAAMALVGHSERRQNHGESDAVVAAKAQAALHAGLRPIVCLGETLAEREAGQTESVVEKQLQAVLDLLGPPAAGLVVAYEPVWAIGTGRTATPHQAQAVHAALRMQYHAALGANAAPITLIYGGSMNAANAAELLAQPDIDGGLIGGASLKAADFLTIIKAAGQADAIRHAGASSV